MLVGVPNINNEKLQERLYTAELLHNAWIKNKKSVVEWTAGIILESYCYGKRNTTLNEWEAKLSPPSHLEAICSRSYSRHVCKVLSALSTQRSKPISTENEETPFGFLNGLENFPLCGRPHQLFLEAEALEQARISAATEESKKDKGFESFIKCRRCGSGDVDTDAKQTRSADEPMTVFACCNGCGSRWTMS
jgi:DNA-directed RNA polymerase subunit M/transcription elongation factor TFIIS